MSESKSFAEVLERLTTLEASLKQHIDEKFAQSAKEWEELFNQMGEAFHRDAVARVLVLEKENAVHLSKIESLTTQVNMYAEMLNERPVQAPRQSS
jgi:hypothetical protein